MPFLKIFVPIILILFLLCLSLLLVCFFVIFYSKSRKIQRQDEFPIPDGEAYLPFKDKIIGWIKDAREMPHKDVSIVSKDGLKLVGRYYEHTAGAPIEILFHGYRGSAERDMSAGIFRCFRLGRNALVVDHRASGGSEGHIITFGIKERYDCLDWVNYVIENIDPEARIIITGISMGAATVMSATGLELPSNVKGVLADCGYTSAKQIIKKVMRDMHLPANLLYPFARLSAIIFGRFDPEESSPIESMRSCTLPIIFYHGDADGYVPCYMSRENYEACTSQKKRLVIIPGADHGLCYPTDKDGYVEALHDFFPELSKYTADN